MIEATASGWVARTEDDVRAVLGDDRFGVLEAAPADRIGTIAWLRGSVSRFANGPEHGRRRSVAEAELARVDPRELRTATRAAAADLFAAGAGIAFVARRAPSAALAGLLGIGEATLAAAAADDCAAGYFPGAGADAEARGDRGTARLLTLLAGVPLEVAVARIALLVQGYDATGALVEAALAHGGPLDVVLREHPPLAAMRRVAHVDVHWGEAEVRAGDPVVLDIAAASDPAVLTFGAGRRPCPGEEHALAAAQGVLDARCGVTR